MKYFMHDFDMYRLHIIKTKKFKTVSVKIVFSSNVNKREITIKNLLSDIMVYTSKKYSKRNDLSIALQDLYSMELFSNCYRIGNLYNMEIIGTFLNEKYTENGLFEQSLDMLSEIVFNPNVDKGRFDKDSFDSVKEMSRNSIESVKENTRKLSLIKMLENMDSKAVYSTHGFGYIDDLNKITEKKLYEYYKKVLDTNKIDVYVLGDIDIDNTVKLFEEKFKFSPRKTTQNDFIINHSSYRKRIKKVIEKEPVSQSKLSIGCKLVDLDGFERNYVLPLYSIILGGGSDSKFFKEIRENNSLCYYIFSSPNKLDNILLISSGISSGNFEKTLKLIKKSMKEMIDGDFKKEEIEKAKVQYITMLNEFLEDPYQILSTCYSVTALNYDDIETRIKKIKTVTYEDIKKLGLKVHMDTVFLLKGDD